MFIEKLFIQVFMNIFYSYKKDNLSKRFFSSNLKSLQNNALNKENSFISFLVNLEVLKLCYYILPDHQNKTYNNTKYSHILNHSSYITIRFF